jgi:hypothetical protein
VAIELYQFLHSLNVFYNRLYVVKYHLDRDFPRFRNLLDNSLYYVKPDDALAVHSLHLHSPALFIFKGDGETLKQIREFIKDFWYRNKQEKEMGRIAVMKEMDSFFKDVGFTQEERKKLISRFINLSAKMIEMIMKKNVELDTTGPNNKNNQ